MALIAQAPSGGQLFAYLMFCALLLVVLLLLWWLLAKVVRWAKRRPTGAYLILAIFPLISLLPIPPTEIKKMQQIKQQQVRQKEESGEPIPDKTT